MLQILLWNINSPLQGDESLDRNEVDSEEKGSDGQEIDSEEGDDVNFIVDEDVEDASAKIWWFNSLALPFVLSLIPSLQIVTHYQATDW